MSSSVNYHECNCEVGGKSYTAQGNLTKHMKEGHEKTKCTFSLLQCLKRYRQSVHDEIKNHQCTTFAYL